MDSKKEMRQRVLKLINGPRGTDFLRCFEDMSLRDASKICLINFSTLRYIKQNRSGLNWEFHELRMGRLPATRWKEIQEFREEMIEDIFFKDFRDILLQAAQHGWLVKSVCAPKGIKISQSTAAFLKASHDQAKAQEAKIEQLIPDPPANTTVASHGQREWTVFTSLNQQQQQIAHMNMLAQQAMQIVRDLPPPVRMTAPVPNTAQFVVSMPPPGWIMQALPAIPPPPSTKPPPVPHGQPRAAQRVSLGHVWKPPPPPVQIVRLPPPPTKPAPVPRGLPPKPPPVETAQMPLTKKEYREGEAQVTATMILEDVQDATVQWKSVTPRDISAPPHQLYYEPFPKDRASSAVQLRPWMLAADLMFMSTYRRMNEIKLQHMNQRRREILQPITTPQWIYTAQDYWGRIQYGMESVLPPDPERDALPGLEPITDWGWLLTMGLAR